MDTEKCRIKYRTIFTVTTGTLVIVCRRKKTLLNGGLDERREKKKLSLRERKRDTHHATIERELRGTTLRHPSFRVRTDSVSNIVHTPQ